MTGIRRASGGPLIPPASLLAFSQGFEGDERAMNGRRTIKRKTGAATAQGIDTCSVTTTSLLNSDPELAARPATPDGVPGPPTAFRCLALLRSTPLTEDQIKEGGAQHHRRRLDGPRRRRDRQGRDRRVHQGRLTSRRRSRRTSNASPPSWAAAGWPLAGVDDSTVLAP